MVLGFCIILSVVNPLALAAGTSLPIWCFFCKKPAGNKRTRLDALPSKSRFPTEQTGQPDLQTALQIRAGARPLT